MQEEMGCRDSLATILCITSSLYVRRRDGCGYQAGYGGCPISSGVKLELSIMTPTPTFDAFCTNKSVSWSQSTRTNWHNAP